ncbi:hypothetical protein J6590_000539 [Homalodisca vitripennis]|nr:hypothetical protein J6590_000539 [Homalodisca vitripennis]
MFIRSLPSIIAEGNLDLQHYWRLSLRYGIDYAFSSTAVQEYRTTLTNSYYTLPTPYATEPGRHVKQNLVDHLDSPYFKRLLDLILIECFERQGVQLKGHIDWLPCLKNLRHVVIAWKLTVEVMYTIRCFRASIKKRAELHSDWRSVNVTLKCTQCTNSGQTDAHKGQPTPQAFPCT